MAGVLEAALIVGILVTYLARSGQRAAIRFVWAGTVAAVVAALLTAAASNGLLATLDPDRQEVAQAGMLFLAVGVLTWMVLWMHRNGRGLRGDLHRKAGAARATGRLVGLATIAFTAVFREGIETALFMWGIVVQRADLTAVPLLVAGVAGIGLAIATAWLFFSGFKLLQLQTFFRVTGALLLFVAAGLLSSRLNKLIGLGDLPPLMPQVWDTSWLLRDDSILGAMLGAFLGYRSRPSLLEILAVVAYIPSVLWLLRRADLATRQPQPQAGSA